MPKISININDVDESNVIPAGWYSVRVTDCEIRDSQSSDSQYIAWTLDINEGEYTGRKLWLNSSLKENALPMLKRFLMAANFEWDDDGFDPSDVLGSELEVKVAVRVNDGEKSNDVKSYRAI